MPKIFKILIETENGADWNRARKLFDEAYEGMPMTTPYKFEVKISNAWSRTVEANRDEKWFETLGERSE